MLCPFCMQSHPDDTPQCPTKKTPIPIMYRNDTKGKDGVPVIVMLTIGYPRHGKTCFLSSFFYALQHGLIAKEIPGFTRIAINPETLRRISQDYVNVLDGGHVPPATPVIFPTPLLMKFFNIPFKKTRHLRTATIEQQRAIFVFYDVGGETFRAVDDRIQQNIPIIKEIQSLLFLISLPDLLKEQHVTGKFIGMQMHTLLNSVYIALEELGLQQQKNLLICFTKGDLMWEQSPYGPLAARPRKSIPPGPEILKYMDELEVQSESIQQYIQQEYLDFYNLLQQTFKTVRFTTLSALGTAPREDLSLPYIAPTHVFDPFLWMLRLEGYL